MVEYTSDICRVDSSNLFRPNKLTSVAELVDALNLEFSFLFVNLRVQVSSGVLKLMKSFYLSLI